MRARHTLATGKGFAVQIRDPTEVQSGDFSKTTASAHGIIGRTNADESPAKCWLQKQKAPHLSAGLFVEYGGERGILHQVFILHLTHCIL